MRLTHRLGLVIAMAMAPVVAVESYNVYSLIEQERAKGHQTALDYVRYASWEMQRLLEGMRGTMHAVALSPSVRSRDWSTCQSFLNEMMAGLPQLTALSVADRTGTIRCGRGAQSRVKVTDRPYFAQAMTGDEFVVGEYTVGRSSGRPVLPLAGAVRSQNGSVQAVVIAAVDLQWLSNSLAQRGLPPEGSITMSDRNGVILARQPLPERFIGTHIPDKYLYLLKEPKNGTIELTSQDGTQRILGYSPTSVPPDGIYISAGLGIDYSYAGVYSAALRSAIVIVLAVTIAILASAIISRRFISRPMSRLVATAERWRAGDLKSQSDVRGKDEFGTLGEVLDGAIAQARTREERITVLVREVTHRVKNQMAVMLSMARHVGKNSSSVAAFQKAFSERIMAMARSHDLVFGAAEEAQLAVLILSQLEPFAIGARVDISGPDVRVTAQSAQYIGMAIHELATNCAKYGAWSVPDGRVTIAWSLLNGAGSTLRIHWKEHGGPAVMPRSAMGFGSTVLESVVGPALGGWSELKFEPTGVSWICEFSGHFEANPSAQAKVA